MDLKLDARPIYLDYAATTPVDPRVVQAMVPYLYEQFGNPASRSHAYGWAAEEAVEIAREHVAELIGADPREIVWTSGATESNNLAIKGAAQFHAAKGRHLITAKTEHKAVLDTMRELERHGFEVTLPRRAAERPARPRRAEGRDPPRHHPGLGDVRQQRDRRDPGHRRDRRAVPQQGHPVPCRRGAGQRQGRDRPGRAAGRPDEPVGAQDLRPQGHRCALRAPQAARAHRGADARRRPRARHALRHAGHAPDRRHGRGLPARAGVDGQRERTHRQAARPAARRHAAASPRCSSTATCRSACRTT